MSDKKQWCQQGDQLLKYLYQDLKIFNWGLISKQISQRLEFQVNADECRNRYLEKYSPVIRDEWTPQEQKELYRLHNQNGNRWAVIALNLLGRNDNCVKNHFYSKLRKSLRTINKIAKLHLKKQAKQISDVVIYKLTEATDQSLKQNSEVPKQIIAMCYDLKNKLLQYQMDQKDIKDNLDYRSEKQLLHGLADFNKVYKKKSKKQKTSILGSENLKKKRGSSKAHQKNNNPQFDDLSYEVSQSKNLESSVKNFQTKRVSNRIQQSQRSLPSNYEHEKKQQSQYNPPRSQSEYSVYKRTVNFLIKAPSKEQKANYQKSIDILSSSSKLAKKQQQSQLSIPLVHPPSNFQPKPKSRIQDILKAEGILQNGFGLHENGNQNYFRRESSVRSFSICSESSNMDMFGDDLGFSAFKDHSQLDNQSQIFKTQKDE